jgi:hypothetical protein
VPPLVIAAWIGGLVAVIGFAMVGRDPVTSRQGSVIPEHSATPTSGTTDPGPGAAVTVPERRVLVVRGRVARDAANVRIGLTTGGGTTVAIASLDPTGHGHGSWVPFESRLVVSRSDADLGQALYIRTMDPSGSPVGVGRRPFSASLFLEVRADGIAAADGSTSTRLRGYPSSSPVSVFGRAGRSAG